MSFVAASAQAKPASGQSDSERDTIERILADWRMRAEALGTIHCVAEGTAVVPQGCYNGNQFLDTDVAGDVPAADYAYQCRYEWLFDFRRARFRIRREGDIFHMGKRIFVPRVETACCDGVTKPCILTPRELNMSDAHVPSPSQPEYCFNIRSPTLRLLDTLMLFAHGTVRNHAGGVRPEQIGATLSKAKDFMIHAPAERLGRRCIVLRSIGNNPTNIAEYWVDPDRQSAIVHWELRNRNVKAVEVGFEYQHTAGLWLPRTLEYTKYTDRPENPPEHLCRMKMTTVAPNVPVSDAMFRLEPRKGMVVWDDQTQRSYRLGDAPGSSVAMPKWLVGPAVVILVIVVIVWRHRKGGSLP